MQLDLFLHGADVAFRNEVIAAINNHDLIAMRTAIDQLRAHWTQDERLPDFDALYQALRALDQPELATASITCQLQHIETQLQPAIQRVVGTKAARWLAPVYNKLALAAQNHPFSRNTAQTHAGSLFLRANVLTEARIAISSIPSWRQLPEPLAWMCEIALRENNPAEYWPLIAELAWIAPALLEAQLTALQKEAVPSSVLLLYKKFCSTVELDAEEDELSWFPAWLLIEHPELQPLLRTAHAPYTPPARCASLLIDLLISERQGQPKSLLEKRKELRDRTPTLFRCYMARR